jgi:hypothetical protein
MRIGQELWHLPQLIGQMPKFGVFISSKRDMKRWEQSLVKKKGMCLSVPSLCYKFFCFAGKGELIIFPPFGVSLHGKSHAYQVRIKVMPTEV